MVYDSSKLHSRERKSVVYPIRMEPSLYRKVIKEKIQPEIIRSYIRDYNAREQKNTIKSDDWQALEKILPTVPSLQIVGDVGKGKSHLMKQFVKNNTKYRIMLFDSHDEYEMLPATRSIIQDFTESYRITLAAETAAAKTLFGVYANMLLQPYPEDVLVIIEEGLRYKETCKQLLAECRKFAKLIVLSQEKLVSYVPAVYISK